MKLYPGATYRPLGPQNEPGMEAHDIVCVHTMVGHLYGTDILFKRNGYSGTESHYGIGGIWGPDLDRKLDGVIYQWQNRRYTADANLEGNGRVISIETADNYPKYAKDIRIWTPKQVIALVDLIAWECSPAAHSQCPSTWKCHTVGIPATLIPDTKPGRRGLAYHRQGVNPWRVTGGELWSTANGKECPGPVRIKQFTTEIIPKVQAKLKPPTRPDPAYPGGHWTETMVKNLPTLKRGAKGEDVETAQGLLRARSHPEVEIDGDFGPTTEKAVKAVQRWGGVTANGVIDQKTWPILLRVHK